MFNDIGHQWMPLTEGPAIRSFGVSFVVSLNKLLNTGFTRVVHDGRRHDTNVTSLLTGAGNILITLLSSSYVLLYLWTLGADRTAVIKIHLTPHKSGEQWSVCNEFCVLSAVYMPVAGVCIVLRWLPVVGSLMIQVRARGHRLLYGGLQFIYAVASR